MNSIPLYLKSIEGVLTYLNAFLILDYTRARFKDQHGLAVLIALVVTIIMFYIIHIALKRCQNSSEHRPADKKVNSEIVLIPSHPETFHRINQRNDF